MLFFLLVACVFFLLALFVDSPATYQQCNTGCLGIHAVLIVTRRHFKYS